MSDASTAGAAPAAPAAQANTAPAAAPEDAFDFEIEPGKTVKIPKSKVLDVANPHLAKHRSETDRLRSEYDKQAKELAAEKSKLEQVLQAARERPDDLLKEFGHDPEKYAESKLAARVKAAMQAEEEANDPSKKAAREEREELERLRKESEEFKKSKADQEREKTLGRVKAFVSNVVSKLPEEVRDFATPDVAAIIRQALSQGKDITVDDAAKAARALIIARLTKAKNLLTIQESKPTHPAAAPKKPSTNGKPRTEEVPSAGDFLMDLQWAKRR